MSVLYERVRQWSGELEDNSFTTGESSTQFTVDLARKLSQALADTVLSYENKGLSNVEIMAALPQSLSFMLGGILKAVQNDTDSEQIVRLVKTIGTLLIEENERMRANGKNSPETQAPK